MRKIFTLFFLLFQSMLFASAGYTTETVAKINIQTVNGSDDYQDMTNLSHYSSTYSSTSYFHLKASEAWVYKNNGSDITAVSFYYRIYKQGSTAPSFSSFGFSWQEENGSGTIYQRWGNYSVDIDLLQSVNESGTWLFECYYSASTNATDCDNPIYLNNNGSNYSFTFTADESLPVELTTFTALAKEKTVELAWQTETEVNNYGFNIERKLETGDWSKVGFVQGHGNSNSPKHYSFTDNAVQTGKYLYRLKQIDIDGSFEYSKVVEATIEIPTKLELSQNYPNPFNPTTEIQFSLPEAGNVSLVVYNVIGEQVAELVNQKMDAGYHNIKFDGSKFNSGIYVYRLQTEKSTITKKMILMK